MRDTAETTEEQDGNDPAKEIEESQQATDCSQHETCKKTVQGPEDEK